MTHTFEELKGKTVAQLREVAEGIDHEAVHGFSTMHKEQLLHALCVALNLEEHEHHVVVGIDKRAIKAKIHELKAQRDAALQAHDPKALKQVRQRIHRLKRKIRAATV
jgi:hypothetical protein